MDTFDWNSLADLNVPILNSQLRDTLEGPLQMDEVFEVLKHMKNNKSPGIDGFTVEFMNFFLELFEKIFSEVIELCFFKW